MIKMGKGKKGKVFTLVKTYIPDGNRKKTYERSLLNTMWFRRRGIIIVIFTVSKSRCRTRVKIKK